MSGWTNGPGGGGGVSEQPDHVAVVFILLCNVRGLTWN